MKLMERYGQPIEGYEGTCSIRLEEGENRLDTRGYFEAAHFPSGRISVRFIPTHLFNGTKVESSADANCTLTFSGDAVGGWHLNPGGQILFSRNNWLLAPMAVQPTELNFGTQYLEARRRGMSKDGYTEARFLISNFLWHDSARDDPEPINLEVRGFRIVVSPVVDYQKIAQRLISGHGVEPTAQVCIESPLKRRGASNDISKLLTNLIDAGRMVVGKRGIRRESLPLAEFRDCMDDLSCVFRVITGNRVDWYYGEVTEESTGNVVERIHKYAESMAYSNTIRYRPIGSNRQSLIPKLDITTLAPTLFEETPNPVDRSALRVLINQFTNACDETSYMESRGLLASTLTELIVAKYSEAVSFSEYIEENEFKRDVLPELRQAVRGTCLPQDVKDHIGNQIQGVFRNSFRSRLRRLAGDLGLPLDSQAIHRIVSTRDSLVHRGTYCSEPEDGGWHSDYQFITWVNLIAICRLLGYEGELPEYRDGPYLET